MGEGLKRAFKAARQSQKVAAKNKLIGQAHKETLDLMARYPKLTTEDWEEIARHSFLFRGITISEAPP